MLSDSKKIYIHLKKFSNQFLHRHETFSPDLHCNALHERMRQRIGRKQKRNSHGQHLQQKKRETVHNGAGL